MNEFVIDDFDSKKHYIIEASAGTGKTHNIINIVRKLVDGGVPIEKILIVTYTNKAAGELKDRIRKILPNGNVDKATIGTIHSFCGSLIDEFFVSAKKPTSQDLIDEKEVKDFISRYIRKGAIYQDIQKLKKGLDGSDVEKDIVDELRVYLDKFYLDQSFKSDNKVVSLENNPFVFRVVSSFMNGEDVKQVPEVKEAIRVISNSNYKRKDDFMAVLNQPGNTKLSYNAQTFKSSKNMTEDEKAGFDLLKKVKECLEDAKKNYIHYLVYQNINDLYQAWQKEKELLSKQTFADMIRDVRENVVNEGELLNQIREKYTYAIIDEFQDTNQLQWDVFSKAFICDDHYLIVVGDPKQSIYAFQGADVTVYNSAKGVISHCGEASCLSKNYRSTKDMIESVGKFFTQDGALDMPNGEAFQPSSQGDDCYFDVEYQGQRIKPFWISEERLSENQYAEIVCRKIIEWCSRDENTGKTKLQIKSKEGNASDVSFRDFAVLGKTKTEMLAMKSAFEKYGIPYFQDKDDSLFKGKECAHLIAILDAINAKDFYGDNRLLLRKALLTMFFGISMNAVHDPKYDIDTTEEVALFSKWRTFAEELQWEEMISSVINDTGLTTKLGSLKDLKPLSVIKQLGEYCADYLTKTNRLSLLIKNLRMRNQNISSNDNDENGDRIAKSTDFDCVRMMTIHASKGLEFPVVISVAGLKNKNTQFKEAYCYHDTDGHRILTFRSDDKDVVGEEKAEVKRLYYVAYTRAKYVLMLPTYQNDVKRYDFVRNLIESYRDNSDNEAYVEKMPTPQDITSDETDLQNAVKKILSPNNSGIGSGTDEETQQKTLASLKGTLPHRYSYKHAYSSLSHGKDDGSKMNETQIEKSNGEESADDIVGLKHFDENPVWVSCEYDSTKEPIELTDNFPAGTGLGNALHEVFEKIDYKDESTATTELIHERFQAQNMKWDAEWGENIQAMVHEVLNAKLPVIHGGEAVTSGAQTTFTLSELSKENRKNEVEFNFNKEVSDNKRFKHYFNGFVDLVFKRKIGDDDVFCILDWKSDRLNEKFSAYNNAEIMCDHVAELYAIQRVLYAHCLVQWLNQVYDEASMQETFEKHFGGVYYVFLRGCNADTGNGVYAQTWKSYDELDKCYQLILKEKVSNL